MHGTSRPVV